MLSCALSVGISNRLPAMAMPGIEVTLRYARSVGEAKLDLPLDKYMGLHIYSRSILCGVQAVSQPITARTSAGADFSQNGGPRGALRFKNGETNWPVLKRQKSSRIYTSMHKSI